MKGPLQFSSHTFEKSQSETWLLGAPAERMVRLRFANLVAKDVSVLIIYVLWCMIYIDTGIVDEMVKDTWVS